MRNLNWEPIYYEPGITSLGRTSSFFFQHGRGQGFLFIHESNLTSLLAISTDENRLTVHHVKEIMSSCSVAKIDGNNKCVLMLDVNNELFYLQGTQETTAPLFTPSNGMSLLSNKGALTWHRLTQLSNCLSITGFTDFFAFLSHNQFLYSLSCKSVDTCNSLSEISRKSLNHFNSDGSYFSSKLTGEIAKIVNNKILKIPDPTDEALVIIEPTEIIFSKLTPKGQLVSESFSADFQGDSVTTVLDFYKNSSIFIACKSGKIICLKLNNSSRSFGLSHIFLGKKIYAITGYEDNEIKLLWSDFSKLYLSAIHDDVVTNLQVIHNIRGIRHFIKTNDSIIAVTINGCLYKTRTNSIRNEETVKISSDELLTRIYESAKVAGKLNEEIKKKECLIEALEMSKIPDISGSLNVTAQKGFIKLHNNTKYIFKKELWKVQFEWDDFHRKKLEMRKLDSNIAPNESVSFHCSGKKSFNFKIRLICDILPYTVLSIEPRAETVEQESNVDMGLADFNQFLRKKCTFIA